MAKLTQAFLWSHHAFWVSSYIYKMGAYIVVFDSTFALLINRTQTLWSSPAAGLRQGCPLLPYLFIL